MDISKNVLLEELNIEVRGFSTIDLSKNTKLKKLFCGGKDMLTSLDVSNNTELVYLDCYHNQLTNLDLSKNTKLEALNCSYNLLSTIVLNKIFNDLPTISLSNSAPSDDYQNWHEAIIGNNSGTADCNRSIATNKGWKVKDNW